MLSRRQELPPEAFFTVSELKAMYGDGNQDGVVPIIAISFCWDTAAHPDPRGKQLSTVAAALSATKAAWVRATARVLGSVRLKVRILEVEDPKR